MTQDQLDALAREIKAASTSLKDLNDSFQKDLVAVRTYAEQHADKIAGDTKLALERVVGEKYAALDAAILLVKKQADEIETAMKRPGVLLGGKVTQEDIAAQIKSATAFYTDLGHARKTLVAGEQLASEKIDLDHFCRYASAADSLYRKGPNQLTADEQKDLMVGSDPMGGYWVLPALSSRIQSIVYESSPIRQLATVENISTDALEFPIDDQEAAAGWLGETETPSTTNTPEVGMGRITVHTMYAKPRATQQLLEDAAVNVEQWLGRKIAEKFSRLEANRYILGNGVKSPRGILTYPAGAGRGNVLQVASGAAATYTADVIKQVPYKLKEPYLAGSSWLMNRTSIGAIAVLREDGATGQYLWRPGLETAGPSTLVGYPLRMAADFPALAAGVLGAGFGNWREAYTIVDRLGITIMRDPYSAKPFVEFWARRRTGGDVTNFEAFLIIKVATSL